MSGRLAELFVAPGTTRTAAVVPLVARAVVVGARDDVPPLAAAVALALRAADRAPAAVVALWRADGLPGPAGGGLVTRGAARLADSLVTRELTAVARGRLTWLALPEDPAAATAAVRRAAAAAETPLVTALAGARPRELEDLVGGHDLAVVAAAPESATARAALTGFAARRMHAVAARPLRRGPARTLALAGIAAPRLDPPLVSRHGATALTASLEDC